MRLLRALGVKPDNVTAIAPGVEVPPIRDVRPVRRIVCLGHVVPQKGFRTAMRAADYLAYLHAGLELHIVGTGPYLPFLRRFGEGVFHSNRVHLHGACRDAGSILAAADVCWVPSLAMTGTHAALEAMAAGVPVVASDLPHLRELIAEGDSGMLTAPGHALALARVTQRLLSDDDLRQHLGEGGRRRAQERFPVHNCVERWRQLYGLASPCTLERQAVGGTTQNAESLPLTRISIARGAAPRNNSMKSSPANLVM